MKILLIALLIFPILSRAQNKRSAKELAKENVNEYLVSSVFKTRPYKEVSFGELKSFGDKLSDVIWVIDNQVETTETRKLSDTISKEVKQLYNFRFYLDRKFHVLTSDCHFRVAKE
jgi:hypothetical protein